MARRGEVEMEEQVERLAEESAVRLEQLTVRTIPAVEKADDVNDYVARLTPVLEDVEGARGVMDAASNAVAEGRAALVFSMDRSKAGLADLKERVGETETKIALLVDQVKEALAHLSGRTEEVTGQISGAVAETRRQFSQLKEESNHFQVQLQEQWNVMEGGLRAFHDEMTSVTGALDQRKSDLLDDCDEFENLAKQKVESLMETFESVVSEANEVLQEVTQVIDSASETSLQRLEVKLLSDARGELMGSSVELQRAIDSVHEAAESGKSSVDQSHGRVLETSDEVMELIARMRPLIDAVRRIAW